MSTDLLDSGISDALFPKARRVIMGLLFGHADEAFFLRQIVDLTGLGVGHVQRELERLVKAGILVSMVRGRHRYFQVNRKCPVFEELRGLVAKTSGVVELIRGGLAPIQSRIRVAFVYGSVARLDEDRESDLDLMVLGDVTLGEIAPLCRELEEKLRRPVNPSVYPVVEFAGKLREQNHFLSSVVKGDKLFVIGGTGELEAILG
jgi:uncharacterized protein